METPRRRAALETRTNLAGRAEKPHKPQVAAQQPASSQRPRRGREAADAPKAARSAQCVRRERGLATWMNFVLAPGGSASRAPRPALSRLTCRTTLCHVARRLGKGVGASARRRVGASGRRRVGASGRRGVYKCSGASTALTRRAPEAMRASISATMASCTLAV